MKIIGIIMRINDDKYYVKNEIIKLLKIKKCIPISIYDKEGIDLCGGIIVPGGDNITKSDLDLIKYAYEKDIPTLGICLGMQEMGYLFNGKMNMISNYNHLKPNLKYVHKVHINKNSKLYNIYNKNTIYVNSRHKDYLVSTDLFISGTSDVIESIEDKNKKFFVGVQWHPESMITYDIDSNKLFDCFIEKSS